MRAAFARTLLAAHDQALAPERIEPSRITIGVSDHALGTSFDGVLRRLRTVLPSDTAFTVRLGQSFEVRDLFEAGDVDFAVIRREGSGSVGEVLGEDPLLWRSSPAIAEGRPAARELAATLRRARHR